MKSIKFFILSSLLFINTCLCTLSDSVLLIINYNHPHYNSVPLLRQMYAPYFNNIVFYGPTQHQDIHYCPHHMGYLSYFTIADAMKRYPHFDGYLFLMDDCILNAWLIQDLDQTKVWYANIGFLADCSMGARADLTQGFGAINWDWWKSQWGCVPMTNSYNALPEKYKKMLELNYGPSTVIAAFSDVVYIPAQYKEQFIELAHIFGKRNAFLETALPTMVSCFSLRKDWIPLYGNSTYGPGWTNASSDFDINAHFNHPLKLSIKENREFVSRIFAEQIKDGLCS